MKMINYRLQSEMEQLKPSSTAWFKSYLKEVLESDKPYYVKADYIGLSFQELQNKIDYLSSDIKELQTLKKVLSESKTTALEVTAEVLTEYGINKIEGTAISSITITSAKNKTKENLIITNPNALIKLGYSKVVIDEDAVKEAMLSKEGMNKIQPYVEVSVDTEKTPARIRVNAKRNSLIKQAIELIETDEQKAA